MLALTRDELIRHPSRLLSSGRNRTKAEVSLIAVGSERIVLKDFRGRGFLVRNTIGRFSVARECRALARLAGVPGIPAFRGRIGPHALAWAFVEGRPLPDLEPRTLPSAFFDALDQLLADTHGRGVAVSDLHHRNVIVGEPGPVPALIDFSLSLVRPAARWNLPGRWLFARAVELDRIAAARIRSRYEAAPRPRSRLEIGGRPPDADRAGVDSSVPRWYRFGRAIKGLMRRLRGKS